MTAADLLLESVMSEPAPDVSPNERSVEGRLDSWKEIAEYLNRDVTTVQRWEKREGMPVHRHVHDRISSVYASRADLDAWMRGRNLPVLKETGNNALLPESPPQETQVAVTTSQTRWRLILLLAATAA